MHVFNGKFSVITSLNQAPSGIGTN